MKKYAIVEISKKISYDTRSINMITILYWIYKFRFEVRVSDLVCMLNFNS